MRKRDKTIALPCRTEDTAAPDLLVSALGEVETPLRQATYDPTRDRLQFDSGGTIEAYYGKHLGIQHFQPLDRRVFKSPPVGWLSWMFYGRDVTPEEVLVNARWLAANLKEYGVTVVLIDDGWQKDNRNWNGTRKTFPQGMKWLADEIRKLGLTPALWTCPHGQDDAEVIGAAGGFIQASSFGGPYTVDATDPRGLRYLRALIQRLTQEWGVRIPEIRRHQRQDRLRASGRLPGKPDVFFRCFRFRRSGLSPVLRDHPRKRRTGRIHRRLFRLRLS